MISFNTENKKTRLIDPNFLPFEKIHEGKWVVLSRSTREIFSFDDDPKAALELANEKGCKDPVLHKAFPSDTAFIPYHEIPVQIG